MALTTSQTDQDLITITYPATITGIRWSMEAHSTSGTGQVQVYWALAVVRDGDVRGVVGTSGSFYNPEGNVLAFGIAQVGNTTGSPHWYNFEGNTKTMRKLMGGDKIVLVAKAGSDTAELAGIVQFFLKA